ncbi:transposase IS3/IS911 family protein [Methylobacterium sp. GXF4]|nr:transposase IS3/IS911 family protein [Methylobacterium sp. GXF4]
MNLVASSSDEAAEIAYLRREPDRTRMERVVLKKAIGISAEIASVHEADYRISRVDLTLR